MKNIKNLPNYLAAVDKKTGRIFVLASPNLSAIKIDGVWTYHDPLSDEEIKEFELISDLVYAAKLVKEAKNSLGL